MEIISQYNWTSEAKGLDFFENFEILELLKIEPSDCQPACSSYSFHQESIQYADMFQGLFMRFLILQRIFPGLEKILILI